MGCSQSASKPVPRPDDAKSDAAASSSSTGSTTSSSNSIPTALAPATESSPSSNNQSAAIKPADVQVQVAQPTPAVSQLQLRPLVVCGPSGVGKGTLLTKLLKEYPNVFAKSVSHTTRAPRQGEVNGHHYHFIQLDELLKGVSEGKFVEHANVHGNYYGTSISSVTHVRDSGKICLLEIDIQGVLAVKKVSSLNPQCIFVRAPTFQDLVDRLNGRGTESEATMAKRLDTARNEMDFFYTNRHIFDADLINSDFETSYVQLIDSIQKLYPEVKIEKPAPAAAPIASSNL